MLYRRFGRTELDMPVFSCGGMRYQQSWKADDEVSSENQRNLEATLRRALELGVRHIETARGYGTSEKQLGRILPTLPRDEIIVQTKVPPARRAGKFRRNVLDSLSRLGLDHVDLFAIHGLNLKQHVRQTMRWRGCLHAARQLRAEGRIRHIGFSTHAPTRTIIDLIETGSFDYVNLHWYYIFQDNFAAIEAAAKQDMGVFIISPSDKGGMLYNPPSRLQDLCAPLTPMAFNDLFCLSEPRVHTLSIGASCPGDFDEHISALDHIGDAPTLLSPILERLQRRLDETLGAEFARTWQQGLPEWNELPNDINVRVIVWLRNLARAFDMVEYGRMRYGLLGGKGGHWMPGNHAGEIDRDKLLRRLRRSPHVERIPALLEEAHELLSEG